MSRWRGCSGNDRSHAISSFPSRLTVDATLRYSALSAGIEFQSGHGHRASWRVASVLLLVLGGKPENVDPVPCLLSSLPKPPPGKISDVYHPRLASRKARLVNTRYIPPRIALTRAGALTLELLEANDPSSAPTEHLNGDVTPSV